MLCQKAYLAREGPTAFVLSLVATTVRRRKTDDGGSSDDDDDNPVPLLPVTGAKGWREEVSKRRENKLRLLLSYLGKSEVHGLLQVPNHHSLTLNPAVRNISLTHQLAIANHLADNNETAGTFQYQSRGQPSPLSKVPSGYSNKQAQPAVSIRRHPISSTVVLSSSDHPSTYRTQLIVRPELTF